MPPPERKKRGIRALIPLRFFLDRLTVYFADEVDGQFFLNDDFLGYGVRKELRFAERRHPHLYNLGVALGLMKGVAVIFCSVIRL